MEDQSWFDKNDDWIGALMTAGGQYATMHSMNTQGGNTAMGGDKNTSTNLNDAKGVPVAFNFPTWIPIIAVLAIVVYFFKKK
jgi:hypothetical protein